MKEKKVDIYLAEAAIYHVVLIGVGGAGLNEIFQEPTRWIIVILSGLLSLGLVWVVHDRISKAKAVIKKIKKLDR